MRWSLVGRSARAGTLSLLFLALSAFAGTNAQDAPDAARTAGLVGVGLTYPTNVSIDFGMIATRMPANFECHSPCRFHGLTLRGTAGLGGGEIALGYGSLVGETGSGAWILRRVFFGYGVRAAVLRTWGMSTLDADGATFAGVEGAFTIAQFGMKLGVFKGIATSPDERDWRVFGGMGWGF